MPGTGSYTYLIIQKVFWWSAPLVIFFFCSVASTWSKMFTDLHQSLRLLDNPAGQSRHRERRGGKASGGWSGFCHQGLKSADSSQELVLKLAPPWCSGHDSCQRLGKSWVGRSFSHHVGDRSCCQRQRRGISRLCVFSSRITNSSSKCLQWKSGSTKGEKDKAAKDGCKHGLLRNLILIQVTQSLILWAIKWFWTLQSSAELSLWLFDNWS